MATTLRGYLVLAVYDYCIHHGHAPYVVVVTDGRSVLPAESMEGKPTVTFNLSNNAVRDFKLENEYMSFSARFNGKITDVSVAVEDITWLGSSVDRKIGMHFEASMNVVASKLSAKQSMATSQVGNTKLRLL